MDAGARDADAGVVADTVVITAKCCLPADAIYLYPYIHMISLVMYT